MLSATLSFVSPLKWPGGATKELSAFSGNGMVSAIQQALRRELSSVLAQQCDWALLGGTHLCPRFGQGSYLVSGGLAEGAVSCQVFRIPHAGLVASLLEQGKKNTRTCMQDLRVSIYRASVEGDLLEIDLEMAWLPRGLLLWTELSW